MKKEVKVSVILPSLNTAKYMEDCLESICRQTLEEIEIICVDAGSVDGTWEIIQKYQKKDKRISALLSREKSYGCQVNMGIHRAGGKYIAIVDTDDMAELNMYETLFQTAEKYQADFVKADYYRYSDGKGYNIQKNSCRIVQREMDYNCVLEPSKNPDIFRQLYPATWSGIYRRQFLEENNIRHNETPGASYQDTGFWLLTYFLAKRAYFLDIPFYMYRTDNAESSVYDKRKTYCICDEWQYVVQKLGEHGKVKQYDGPVSYIFYRKYKRNLERISMELRREFLHRFSKDFRKWDKYGHLSFEMFSDDEKDELQSIMADPDEYDIALKVRTKQFLSELEKLPELIIYGMGKVGREILGSVKEKGNVICAAVSEKNENYTEMQEIMIRCIDDLGAYRKSAYVVIAVMTEEYRKQMEQKLQELGFEHVVKIPYGLFHY